VRRAAPPDTTEWPRVAIWHDAGDKVVNPYNAESSMVQWTAVHGVDQIPEIDERIGRHHRRAYFDGDGRAVVELWITERVGHATPIDEETGCGHDDPARRDDFVTDADICAARHIADFWGLIQEPADPALSTPPDAQRPGSGRADSATTTPTTRRQP
jgi:poly(3-hydroxybutyrate) depolymerase